MKLFNLDSPVMHWLGKMADLLILNVLATICCIPIITAGASFTALHYMALKLVRDEETYIVKGFFKSFKQNFKQATIIWLILLVIIAFLAGDTYIFYNVEFSLRKPLIVIITIVTVIVMFIATFVFPVLSKFDNSVSQTIKNAFIISILQLPKTILMFVLNWLPWVLLVFFLQFTPICVLFGFSAPAFASAFLYNKFFKKLEAQILEGDGEALQEEDDGRIFYDQIEESQSDK